MTIPPLSAQCKEQPAGAGCHAFADPLRDPCPVRTTAKACQPAASGHSACFRGVTDRMPPLHTSRESMAPGVRSRGLERLEWNPHGIIIPRRTRVEVMASERISRNRRLTPEEAAKYKAIREQVAVELPEFIAATTSVWRPLTSWMICSCNSKPPGRPKDLASPI